jgi:uncharacterized protein (DUF2345 family)
MLLYPALVLLPTGCCPAHTPSQGEAQLQDLMGLQERAVLQLGVTLAIRQLGVHLVAASTPPLITASTGSTSVLATPAESARQAGHICKWLSRLAAVAPLRRLCCACMCQHVMVTHTPQQQGSQQGSQQGQQHSTGRPAAGAQAAQAIAAVTVPGNTSGISSTAGAGQYPGVLLSNEELETVLSSPPLSLVSLRIGTGAVHMQAAA